MPRTTNTGSSASPPASPASRTATTTKNAAATRPSTTSTTSAVDHLPHEEAVALGPEVPPGRGDLAAPVDQVVQEHELAAAADPGHEQPQHDARQHQEPDQGQDPGIGRQVAERVEDRPRPLLHGADRVEVQGFLQAPARVAETVASADQPGQERGEAQHEPAAQVEGPEQEPRHVGAGLAQGAGEGDLHGASAGWGRPVVGGAGRTRVRRAIFIRAAASRPPPGGGNGLHFFLEFGREGPILRIK